MSASTAGAAAAAVGIVAIPVGLIGGTSYVISRHHRDKEDEVLIESRLKERGLSTPLQISPGTQVQKSAFFPVTPAPTRLVVSEATGGNAGEVSFELPALAGLHLKPVSAASPSDNFLGATH
jgi:hypothetical protein